MADEEQFLLRVADEKLADKLRGVLREEEPLESSMQLVFEEDNRRGTLSVFGENYPVSLLDLPTVVESYKTYDDINLVKTGDIGQMLLVGGNTEPGQTQSLDGVTPPMKNARARHFRKLPDVAPEVVARVERDLMAILDGAAPDGIKFVDVEEEFVVDPATGVGSWQQAPSQPASAPASATGTKPSGSKAKAAAAAAAAAASEAI